MFASKDTLLTRPSGYTIARSVRTRSSATAYFNRTFSTPTLGTKWTWSGWVKRGTLSSAQTLFGGSSDVNNWGYVGFLAGDTLTFQQADAGSVTSTVTTTQVFRDPAAWYHIVVAFDSTQATAANRLIMYVNGVQITAFGTATYLAQNTASRINQAVAHTIYRIPYSAANYVDGYLTEANFIDGQALTPSSFGTNNAITGVWQPAKYTGTYGTNGFYLNFSDNSSNTATTIGKDYSGNGNNWTPNNISVTSGVTYDSMQDVPTLTSATAANYPTWNPNCKGSDVSLANGNLDASWTNINGHSVYATMGFPTTGKWYCEMTGAYQVSFGLVPTSSFFVTTQVGYPNTGIGYRGTDGQKVINATFSAYGATYTTTDTIAVVYDADNLTLHFYKNNTDQGAITVAADSYTLAVGYQTTTTGVAKINFGQRPFTYTPPTGYVALNTYNLPASTITNGAAYMAASLWTGNGTARSISNAVGSTSFQPDLVWVKSRTQAIAHRLIDSIRGAGNTLASNLTNAEFSDPQGVTSFNSGGFGVGTDTSYNQSSDTYVGWQWKAGTTSASNTNGSITSTVSAGATQGFSVVTYTGNGAIPATVGHGLGVAPSMYIVKCRNVAGRSWDVYHITTGSGNRLFLDGTGAAAVANWGGSPTSSVFYISGSFTEMNANGDTYVAYCFAAVAGYSAFGSYTGNGSADGPFIYTGFRPRFVMVKNTTNSAGATNWAMQDSSRNGYNPNKTLYANASSAEDSSAYFDILSNGFKVRDTFRDVNTSGDTYIYACFAENPMKYALSR